MFELVEIHRLVGAADNLRRDVGNVTELASSMRSIGVLEPLLVTPTVDGFAVVAGHRRLAAARKVGLEVVPCVIREMTEVERVVAMVVENEQRSDLSPIESAEGYFRLIDMGVTQKDLAKKVGRSSKHVGSRLALLELPRRVRAQVHSGRLTLAAATALLELVDQPDVIEQIAGGDPADVERAVLRHQIQANECEVEPEVIEPGGEAHEAAVVELLTGEGAAFEGEAHCDTDGHVEDEVVESEWERRSRARSKDEAERRKAMSDARRARVEFVAGLLERRVPKVDVAAHVAATVIETVSVAQARLACRSLGLEPVEGPFGPDYRTALDDHAVASVRNRDRVVLAVCLAKGEEAARAAYPTPLGWSFVEFIGTFGYEPSAGDPQRPVDEGGEWTNAV